MDQTGSSTPVMVGVSTQQNTTNLVPLIQFDIPKLILLETDGARERNWSAGVVDVLEKRCKETAIISAGPGDRLAEMIETLRQTTGYYDSVCWNTGGGQKMQQIALLSVFLERIEKGKDDWACYSEPQQKKTYRVTGRQGHLESDPQPTDVFLDLSEILATFGRKAGGKHAELIWQREGTVSPTKTASAPPPHDLLSALHDFDRRQAMFEYTLAQEEGESPASESPLPVPFGKFSEFFEVCVQRGVWEIISRSPRNHCVNQVWCNVRLFNNATNEELAEYDVLLVTNFGTIIPLDAKTYDFEKKDEHARLLNLERASGAYTTIWSVFPFFTEDLAAKSILQKNKKWNKLLHRPFELNLRHSKMLAMAERGCGSIHIQRHKDKVKLVNDAEALTAKSKNQAVRIHTLEKVISALELQRA